MMRNMFRSRGLLFSQSSRSALRLPAFPLVRYNSNKHIEEESPKDAELTQWEEDEREHEKMKQRTLLVQKSTKPTSLKEHLEDIWGMLNTPAALVIILLGSIVIWDILRPKTSYITKEVSPFDPNLYYVRNKEGEIEKYYVKKSIDHSYVTKIKLDDDLKLNGPGITIYQNGTVIEYHLKEGARDGLERKTYPEGEAIRKAEWENVKDEQRGLKTLYLKVEEGNPLSPVVEVFDAKSHLPVSGGYFSQLLANGDVLEARLSYGGDPNGPATLTTSTGEIIEGVRYNYGKIQGFPEEYLAKNGILEGGEKEHAILINAKEEEEVTEGEETGEKVATANA